MTTHKSPGLIWILRQAERPHESKVFTFLHKSAFRPQGIRIKKYAGFKNVEISVD